QRDPEPRHIKEEDQELWPSQQQEEEQVPEFKEADVLDLPHSSIWENHEHEDTKPGFKVEGKMKDQAASLMSIRMHTEQNQSSINVTRESTELSYLNSVPLDYQCYRCDKSFSSSHHLINHAFRMHSEDAGFLCAVCGKTLESTESLNVHLKSHRGSKCCHVCGKHCSSASALAEHMTSHTGLKLHRCHVCGKECGRKGDLKIHMRIHTGEKPFCCSFCGKSFTHSGHLKKHMRSHTGERPHRCDVCGKGYLQKAHLKYHLGTHTQKY
uniref:C2H2-type domain-containing protein n=1 Tax=Lates calcarifer TaxID=8187 RepID=A0A4W6DK90_LATCA